MFLTTPQDCTIITLNTFLLSVLYLQYHSTLCLWLKMLSTDLVSLQSPHNTLQYTTGMLWLHQHYLVTINNFSCQSKLQSTRMRNSLKRGSTHRPTLQSGTKKPTPSFSTIITKQHNFLGAVLFPSCRRDLFNEIPAQKSFLRTVWWLGPAGIQDLWHMHDNEGFLSDETCISKGVYCF